MKPSNSMLTALIFALAVLLVGCGSGGTAQGEQHGQESQEQAEEQVEENAGNPGPDVEQVEEDEGGCSGVWPEAGAAKLEQRRNPHPALRGWG